MQRFRPNVVIEGLDAFGEDSLGICSIAGIALERSGACERCAVTCTDHESGKRSSQPLRTLRDYRKRDNNYASGIVFGAYMAIEGSGTLSVGDKVYSV
ncbi:MAG: MOSC domain-containing protein [Halioglobus sp.]